MALESRRFDKKYKFSNKNDMVSTWRNLKIFFSRPLFIIIFWPKILFFVAYSILTRGNQNWICHTLGVNRGHNIFELHWNLMRWKALKLRLELKAFASLKSTHDSLSDICNYVWVVQSKSKNFQCFIQNWAPLYEIRESKITMITLA